MGEPSEQWTTTGGKAAIFVGEHLDEQTVSWHVPQSAPNVTIDEVHDFTGRGASAGDRVIVAWHWQTKTWHIIHRRDGFIWVALMERDGTSYRGLVMEPYLGGQLDFSIKVGCDSPYDYFPNWCYFRPAQPLRYVDLVNVNCRSDNCQGGKHPEIVLAWPNPYKPGTYLFEYGDAQEEEDEREILGSWLQLGSLERTLQGLHYGLDGAYRVWRLPGRKHS